MEKMLNMTSRKHGNMGNNPRTSLRRATLFKKLTEETSARRNFEDKDLAYYQAVYEEFGERNAKFIVAELNFCYLFRKSS